MGREHLSTQVICWASSSCAVCMGSAEGWVGVLEERKPLCCSWAGNYFTLQWIRGIAGKSELAVVLADGLEKRWAEQRHQRSSAGP